DLAVLDEEVPDGRIELLPVDAASVAVEHIHHVCLDVEPETLPALLEQFHHVVVELHGDGVGDAGHGPTSISRFYGTDMRDLLCSAHAWRRRRPRRSGPRKPTRMRPRPRTLAQAKRAPRQRRGGRRR